MSAHVHVFALLTEQVIIKGFNIRLTMYMQVMFQSFLWQPPPNSSHSSIKSSIIVAFKLPLQAIKQV